MKKTLIAVAALASTAAFAQVTISGSMVLGYGTTNTGGGSSGGEIQRQTGNIQFAGVEDLGGGLKASFTAQTTLGASAETVPGATSSLLGDRGARLALMGGFGAIQIGRDSSSTRSQMGIGDVSGLPVLTGLSTGVGATDAAARIITGDAYGNAVAYALPTMGGFTAFVSTSPTSQVLGDNLPATTTVGFNYSGGPLNVGANLSSGGTATVSSKSTSLFANYDLGVAKVGFGTQQNTYQTGGNPGRGTYVTANVPMGSGALGFGYGSKSATDSTREGDDMKMSFIGYKLSMSKRTTVALTYNSVNRAGSAADVKETHVMVGHSF